MAADALQELTRSVLALAAGGSTDVVLEEIVDRAMRLTGADGGTLYLLGDEARLEFKVMKNLSLGLSKPPSQLQPIDTRDPDKQALVVVATFKKGVTVALDDVYDARDYDFSGTYKYDEQLGYRSLSFLSVPLKNHESETVGVLQLINAGAQQGQPRPFADEEQELIQCLGVLAATVLSKQQLIEAQKELFVAFVRLIAKAIDHKSPVTGKHCERVPVLATELAKAACRAETGPFADYNLTDDEFYELTLAAWLHDCGKVTTPEHVINKATKLEALHDRIELVRGRMEQYRLRLLLDHQQQVSGDKDSDDLAIEAGKQLEYWLLQAEDDMSFLETVNQGGEFLKEEDKERILRLAKLTWKNADGNPQKLLTEEEVEQLLIPRGTLNQDEIQIMRDHIVLSWEMLETLPYPKHLQQVPDIACNHHECLDGSGYPRGVSAEQLSIPARIMCIADIFEALTAPERPYKKPMPLSQALSIIGKMVDSGKLDADVFTLLVESGVCTEYASQHLSPDQLDDYRPEALPGLKASIA